MTDEPKLFTIPCTVRIPRFITDCCSDVMTESDISSEKRCLSAFISLIPNLRIFSFLAIVIASPMPAAYCDMTVATAAPHIPSPSDMTK